MCFPGSAVLDWTKVDMEAGAPRIEGAVIRIPGEELIVQPHTKSKAGMRTITSPPWVLDLLKRRHVESLCGWIFPMARLTLRNPDNTRARLRDVVRGTPWEGLHPRAFRHLVTQLDRAGLSAREIADYLGHERVSMTQDVYMSRGTNGVAAAAALDRLAPHAMRWVTSESILSCAFPEPVTSTDALSAGLEPAA
jgi:integrase